MDKGNSETAVKFRAKAVEQNWEGSGFGGYLSGGQTAPAKKSRNICLFGAYNWRIGARKTANINSITLSWETSFFASAAALEG